MRAAVLRHRGIVMSFFERALFAVADGADARAVDAEGDQVLARAVGAAVTEGQVVLLGATLVAVPLDQEVIAGAFATLQPVGRGGEGGLRGVVERRLVVVVERVAHVAFALHVAVQLLDVGGEDFLPRRLIDEVRLGGDGLGRIGIQRRRRCHVRDGRVGVGGDRRNHRLLLGTAGGSRDYHREHQGHQYDVRELLHCGSTPSC
jgi:hypothetical protein